MEMFITIGGKEMTKINWKVRFKNPQFIAQITISIFVPILGYAGSNGSGLNILGYFTGFDYRCNQQSLCINDCCVSVYNAIQDPTTSGIGDSDKH